MQAFGLALKELCHSSLSLFWFVCQLVRKKPQLQQRGEVSCHIPMQPSKLKFLLGRHLATNSFGLGRLFYKSSCQLQNFRCHGHQNAHNLEGCHGNKFFGSQQSFFTKMAIKVHLNDGRKVCATILFLLAIMHSKVIHVHF